MQFEIVIDGNLSARRNALFDGFTISGEADGTTVLQGFVIDQAALHGLLQRLRDLGSRRSRSPRSTPKGTDMDRNRELTLAAGLSSIGVRCVDAASRVLTAD